MKPFNEYLAMTAEQIMADPEAPESLRIAARIELEKAQKFNLRQKRRGRQQTSRSEHRL